MDWDDDGDLDLLLGSFQGNFYVRLNEGSREKPVFASESIVVTRGDQPLEVPGHHAIPAVADWDGDGRFDILSGSGPDQVFWFRNVGVKGEPTFASPQALVGSRPEDLDADQPVWPGERTQVCAADYDGDGDLDLLVGDYHYTRNPGANSERHGWVWLFRRR